MLSISSIVGDSFGGSSKVRNSSSTRSSTTDLSAKKGHRKKHHRGEDLNIPLHSQRRASSDCCLHQAFLPVTRERTGGSATTSRSSSPSSLALSSLRPVKHSSTLPSPGFTHSKASHRHEENGSSIPEIFISDDFHHHHNTSSSSSSPMSIDNYIAMIGSAVARKRSVCANEAVCSSSTGGDRIHHSTAPPGGGSTPTSSGAGKHRRSSPMTGRREGYSTCTSTPREGVTTTPPLTGGKTRANSQMEETEDWDGDACLSSTVSNGSGELDADLDTADGRTPSASADRSKHMAEQLQLKILRTRELIKQEQKSRDDNVNEYLKCAASADKQQIARIKAVFEKKNQKSALSIQQLQKKLDNYQRKLQEVQIHGAIITHRQPKEVLRDVGHGLKSVGGNIRDGFTGFSGSGLITKPREFAHLIKNKFGSADNIKEIHSDDETYSRAGGSDHHGEERAHHGSATLPPGVCLNSPTLHSAHQGSSTVTATVQGGSSSGGEVRGNSTFYTSPIGGGSGSGGVGGGSEESECNSSQTSDSNLGNLPGAVNLQQQYNHSPRAHTSQDLAPSELANYLTLEQVFSTNQETQQKIDRFTEEFEVTKQSFLSELNVTLAERLTEERTRVEQLEQQLNDLTELHQNEMENLKSTIADMEEKVQYQSEERVRDLHEMVENCHTRISHMEHQQQQQQQQFLTLEGLENSNARALFVKLINVVLTVLQVLLLVVATVMNVLAPLLLNRTRICLSVLVVCLAVYTYFSLPNLTQTFWSFTPRWPSWFS